MVATIEEKLSKIGLELPDVSTPGGNYVSVNIRNKIAYVAVQFPILNEKYLYLGKLGVDISTEEGFRALEICALNVLAQINKKVGMDRVEGLNHIDIYYSSAGEWDDAPKISNGASDLFVNVLEERGIHTRAIFGVERLPRNFSVGLTASFTLIK